MHGYKEKKNWEQKRMTLLQSKIKCNKAYVVYSETLSIISLVLINVMNIIDVQTLNIYIYIYIYIKKSCIVIFLILSWLPLFINVWRISREHSTWNIEVRRHLFQLPSVLPSRGRKLCIGHHNWQHVSQ
jgi:hypothetical protein